MTGTLDIGDLQIVGGRAISRSGSVDWADPLVGGRIRYELAPGHQLSLRGDVGGFGVGIDFSWQAIAAYGWDFARYNGIPFSGVLGYRALYVDSGLHRLCWADSSQHVCCLHSSQYSPQAHPTRCRRVRSDDDPDERPQAHVAFATVTYLFVGQT